MPTAPAAIQSALTCLAPELPHGARAIVFGSHAEGRASADSDIDLLVIEPEVKDRAAEMIRLIWFNVVNRDEDSPPRNDEAINKQQSARRGRGGVKVAATVDHADMRG
ncbi:MAG: nucleotidyltransferase domain-containing protein, partial [Sulfuritalea sp.]|nr:nucleotidyltransferase domain-containing protein [Sulfuritalea sp.]